MIAATILATLVLGQTQADPLLGSLALPQQGRSMRETSTFRMGKDGKYDPKADPTGDLLEHSNRDNFRIAPGATHVVMDRQGPGVITHIWFTFLGPEPQDWAKEGSANHQEMLLRIYWDGNPKPAIEAPLGDFFANCFGKRSQVISLPVVVEDADSYNCFWRMPFRKSAKIEIVNQSKKSINLLYYNIDWIKLDTLPKDTPYFYAQYNQEYPVQKGKDYTILETTGKGHYVGTVLAVRSRSPSWFGEGDEKVYIDQNPLSAGGSSRGEGAGGGVLWGTGTEDYFLSAWGLQTTSTPYAGTPYFDQWGIVGGHTSAYRWHLNDPIVFQKSIKFTIEHWGWISPDENKENRAMSWNEREDDFSSVAFWYQQGPSTFAARAPENRTLPSLERITARTISAHGEGTLQQQQLDLYPGPQTLYNPEGNYPAKVEAARKAGAETPPPIDPKLGWIEIPFEVKEKEPLRLLLNMTTSYDFGKYQVSLIQTSGIGVSPMVSSGIGGTPMVFRPVPGLSLFTGETPVETIDGTSMPPVKLGGPIDFYSEKILNREFHLLDFWPEPGTYKLRLECVGKNSKSDGYLLGLESIQLRERRPRVKEMGWDKDKDWRKNPVLYG